MVLPSTCTYQMAKVDEDEFDSDNCFKILIATDNHVGFMEKDPIRSEDSMISFEEVISLGKKHDVDFVLLGGDLYHENKPSRLSVHGTMAILRKFCMGNRPIQFEVISDPESTFGHTITKNLNFEDSNLNISMPIFSIHGNHDDPIGRGNLCSLDLLSAAGLVNYFGKIVSLEEIKISPVILRKGTTHLSLYGIGALRDERLHNMFLQKKVKMLRPKSGADDIFNIFVIHQNRVKHGAKNYIPPQFLDDFLDLIIWGHEHECRLEPEWSESEKFYISQPGSSIATSLCEGETVAKHIGLLTVCGKEFRMEKLRLETVRPFVHDDLFLQDSKLNPQHRNILKHIEALCQEKVENMIAEAENQLTGHPNQPKLPLIRLRVDYSGGFPIFNIHRFAQLFVDKVANPKEIVKFNRKREMLEKGEKIDDKDVVLDADRPKLDSIGVEDMVRQYFSQLDESAQLRCLSERELGNSLRIFVTKEEKDAISEGVEVVLEDTQKYLIDKRVDEELLDDALMSYREHKEQDPEASNDKYLKSLEQLRNDSGSRFSGFAQTDMDANDDVPLVDCETPSTRARGRGRGARGTRTRGRGRAVNQTTMQDFSIISSLRNKPAADENVSTSFRRSRRANKGVTIEFSDSD